MRRAGWMLLVLLFVVTGLGVGVWGFWEATHQPKNDTSQAADQQCQINVVQSQVVLKNPPAFKPSGDVKRLEVTDLEKGKGPEVKAGDCLTVKYYGTLAASGKKFDGNYDAPLALQLIIGRGQVIPGWDRGLLGMKVGGSRRLVIPSELAYGPQGQTGIPPNSDLVFEVKVLAAK